MALTANRTGIGLCALAATGCVALAPRGRPVGPVALATIVAAAASALILHGDLARAGDGARLAGAAAGRGRRGRGAVGGGARPTRGARDAGRRSSASPRCSPRPPSSWATADRPAAPIPATGASASGAPRCTRRRSGRSRASAPGPSWPPRASASCEERPVPTRFAHDLALQEWVELGLGGLLAVLAWYVAVARTLAREIGPPRINGAAWLLAPAVAAFPLANLLDWPWALTGTGALWAVAIGGLLAGAAAPNVGPTPS